MSFIMIKITFFMWQKKKITPFIPQIFIECLLSFRHFSGHMRYSKNKMNLSMFFSRTDFAMVKGFAKPPGKEMADIIGN